MSESELSNPPVRGSRWVVGLLVVAAFGLYYVTLSRGPFPGLPAQMLTWHLRLAPLPSLLNSLWGRILRVLAVLPGADPALWGAVFSAVCGALSVGLLALLMMRVRHVLHDPHDPAEVRREQQGRLLAGLVSGLFLAVSIPFWILATRTLSGSFHLLLLTLAAWLLSEYQRTGKVGFLYLLGLLYGVGVTEFATFWIFAPLTALLVMRAMLQRAEFRWPVLIRAGLCTLPGLALYVLNGWTLWQNPTIPLRGFASFWSVIWYIWRDQWHLIIRGPQTTGFLLILSLTGLPWGILFLMRVTRPPWRYRTWQVILRVLILAVAVAVLFNAPFAPWQYFGMNYLVATPYLILAICAGYVAGEFWIMGQPREHRQAGIGQPLRSVMGWVGVLTAGAMLGAAGWNLRVADGRPGTRLGEVSRQILGQLDRRDVLLANGALDELVRYSAWRLQQPLHVITIPTTVAAPYREALGLIFNSPRHQSLLQVSFEAFLRDFLSTDEGLQRIAALDLAEPLREYGYLVPDRLVFRAASRPEDVDLPRLLEAQKPFWEELARWHESHLSPHHPAAIYQQYVLRLASKVANNFGFLQMEQGDWSGAKFSFEQARRLYPDNLSALLNLLTLAREKQLPELPQYEAEWEQFKQKNLNPRIMWALASFYGYVYNPAFLVRHGIMWAVSGKPRIAEAEFRRAAGAREIRPEIMTFLARAYLQTGDLQRGADFYRQALVENPNDPAALLMLAELSMSEGKLTEAAEYLGRAEAAGTPQTRIQFDRILLAYLQGETDKALADLKELVKRERENVPAWGLLAFFTSDGRDPDTYTQALAALKKLQANSMEVRLLLAELYINRQEWAAARAELDEVVRMNPHHVRAWELLVAVDFQERKRDLAEDHVRILLTLDPANPIGNIMLGSFQYARGQYSLAESSYRTALRKRRDPMALNDLAHLLILKGQGLDEARALIDEALVAHPEHPIFLSTRVELNLLEKRYEEAERDLQRLLNLIPGHPQAMLLSAQLYEARGQKDAARDLAMDLSRRLSELPAEQQAQLQALLKRVQ